MKVLKGSNAMKPIIVRLSAIEWFAANKAEASNLPCRFTFPLTIEYLTKHGCFKVTKPDYAALQDGFNERMFADRIVSLMAGEFSHAMKSFRYRVVDWGDAPFTGPKGEDTLVEI